MSINYNICNRCVMDTTAENIVFDIDNNCNFCTDVINNNKHKENNLNIDTLIKDIKKNNNSKNDYDCVVGLSGGVDSAWTLVKVKEQGLNPLAVHMDNGWNTELAQNNIENLVKILNVDLYTEVLDWNIYQSLMNSFFKSDVVDVELLYDNAMFAANFQQASKHNVKFILAGSNTSTEGVRIPSNWNWYKYDKKNIKTINQMFFKSTLKGYPAASCPATGLYCTRAFESALRALCAPRGRKPRCLAEALQREPETISCPADSNTVLSLRYRNHLNCTNSF